MHIVSADDPLKEVFTPEVLGVWRSSRHPSNELNIRIEILEACGPCPSDELKADKLRSLRAWKAAWETYVYTAFACGMFEADKGKDLLARLRSIDDANFRSAMAECEACWFLAGRMRLPVNPHAPGRGAKNLEMRIIMPDGDIGVEVKAPFRERPRPAPGEHVVTWWGDDSDKIAQCLAAANKQFSDDSRNVLIIIPHLRSHMFSHRRALLKAAYVEAKVTVSVNTRTGKTGPTRTELFPEGKFLNTRRPGGQLLKTDGFPAYRRVGAIMCLEERILERHPHPDPILLLDDELRSEIEPFWDRERDLHYSAANFAWVEHDVLVLHNPHAYHPVSQDIWAEFPQFVPIDEHMKWTDGYEIRV